MRIVTLKLIAVTGVGKAAVVEECLNLGYRAAEDLSSVYWYFEALMGAWVAADRLWPSSVNTARLHTVAARAAREAKRTVRFGRLTTLAAEDAGRFRYVFFSA